MNFDQLKNFLAVLAVLMIFIQLSTCSTAFAKQPRSTISKSEFKKQQPCPSTGKPRGACPGYVIDHVVPLKRGGPDKPSNMQWQTKEDAKVKDRWE